MSDKINPKPVRVAVYIDGFNLYYGLKDMGWRKYFWLDVQAFATLLAKDRELALVKYFTADLRRNPDRLARQQTFLSAAIASGAMLEVIRGKFLTNPETCNNCGTTRIKAEEKRTDVNIATHMVNDAWEDAYDLAILVSGDSDLVPPIEVVTAHGKPVFVAFPPRRQSNDLKTCATTSFHINERVFKKSQLPDEVVKTDGTTLCRPPTWT